MKITDTYQDRQKTAAAAKARMVARLAARPGADDPATLERAAERKAIDEARTARHAARREAEAAEASAREEAALAQITADQDAAKAKRDARYAARKRRTGQ
ncbi:DUF6481 family protein [Ancylobacter sp. TS-1]|uniref:DUF6481 family protein n=1 Tax=Ancylobacter sp. TS-1 TaxID=1850374 RepID=UPI001265BBAE|nr:DUF6481 family protein [Ancylobacter sp. TS-1]QFR33658.1 hypothetical protein GBB76_11310 [Ancylobacter sp. TS-1]